MLELIRLSDVPQAKLGVLVIAGMPRFCTLEDQWRGNAVGESCIAPGLYLVKRYLSKRFGQTFKIYDLAGREPAGRSGILFHGGNTQHDTSGCILLGKRFGWLDTEPAILDSVASLPVFMGLLKGVDEVDLLIRDIR